jgi:hypothetical protein
MATFKTIYATRSGYAFYQRCDANTPGAVELPIFGSHTAGRWRVPRVGEEFPTIIDSGTHYACCYRGVFY